MGGAASSQAMTDFRAKAVFLVECYAPQSEVDSAPSAAGRAADASADLWAAGAEVEYLGALIVPGDELAYHVFRAADAEQVAAAGRRAGLRIERVVPSLAVARDGARTPSPTSAIAIEVDRPVGHAPGEIRP